MNFPNGFWPYLWFVLRSTLRLAQWRSEISHKPFGSVLFEKCSIVETAIKKDKRGRIVEEIPIVWKVNFRRCHCRDMLAEFNAPQPNPP
jgi:hypothetical protein